MCRVDGPLGSEGMAKGAISQLQEFVQGSKLFPLPPNCPVLRWGYDTRMAGGKGIDSACLEFRASVAFFLDGIPHHIVGTWKLSKKMAQRDTAERTLALFVNRWGQVALQDVQPWRGEGPAAPQAAAARSCPEGDPDGSDTPFAAKDAIVLAEFCSKLLHHMAGQPVWFHKRDDDSYQAFAEISLFGVPHTFPSKCCANVADAYADAARRALWYLQSPGYEDIFEPDPSVVASAAQLIPEASSSWRRDVLCDDGEERQLEAERKTRVMRVQNRLQQIYARLLEVGTSVWYWTYERQPRDKVWPPLFRATVHVPLANRTFTGSWTRGQREAQFDACTKVVTFLDNEAPLPGKA